MKGNLYSRCLVAMRGTIYVWLTIFRGMSRKGSGLRQPHLPCKISYVKFRLHDFNGFVCSGTLRAWYSLVFCLNRGLFGQNRSSESSAGTSCRRPVRKGCRSFSEGLGRVAFWCVLLCNRLCGTPAPGHGEAVGPRARSASLASCSFWLLTRGMPAGL